MRPTCLIRLPRAGDRKRHIIEQDNGICIRCILPRRLSRPPDATSPAPWETNQVAVTLAASAKTPSMRS